MTQRSSIRNQLRDIPPLRVWPQTIDAQCFNTVRLALLRRGAPLEVNLRRPALTMLLDDECWVAVLPWDTAMPILLWSEFDYLQRAGLHEAVHCRLELFDIRSGLVMRTALDALHLELQAHPSHSALKGGEHAAG